MPKVMKSYLNEEVLNNVMNLFWSKGFFNASIQDLVNVTGLNRTAIYKYFGGKETLFVEMLKRYQQNVTETLLKPLRKSDADVSSIQDFFYQFIRLKQSRRLSCGCFFVATASDLPSHTKIVSSIINDFRNQLHKLFQAAVTNSKNNKMLAESVVARSVADFLVSHVFGLMTLSRASAPLSMLKNQVNEIIRYLESLKQKRSRLE